MHRLNGCPNRRFAYKPRHDAIVNVLCDEINKQGGSRNRRTFHWDSTIEGPQGERLRDQQLARLKPDLWFYDETGLKIVEVTVPYGSTTRLNGRETDTLQARREEKIRKYTALVDAARAQFSVNVRLYVIVVSSLGAIPEATMRDLRHLVLARANGTAKKMVSAAIRGSRDVYLNKTSQQNRGQDREPPRNAEAPPANNQARDPPEEEERDEEESSESLQIPESSEGEITDDSDSPEDPTESWEDDDEGDEDETGSGDLTDRARHVDDVSSEEDPATPWWEGEARNPRPLEGANESGRLHNALDALFGLEV